MSSVLSHVLGLLGNGSVAPSANTLAINASTTRLMLTFVAFDAKTLSKVRIPLSAVSGTLTSTSCVCELWSMTSGVTTATAAPLALIQSRNTVTSTPTGAGVLEFTGFTTTLTPGAMYALIISNAHATPASNNFTVRWVSGVHYPVTGVSTVGLTKRHSTDSGATYGTAQAPAVGARLEYNDGTFYGAPFTNAVSTGVGDGVYGTRESGVLFTTHSNAGINVKGIGCRLSLSGTPTGQPRFRIYHGTTLVATTEPIAQYAASVIVVGVFAMPIPLSAATQYRMVLGETTQSDTSANRFVLLVELSVDDDANSKALMPFGGLAKTYFDGSAWTDTDTSCFELWLILDTDGEFAAAGYGGVSLIAGNAFRRASSF